MKRYNKIVLEAENGIEYILKEENSMLIVKAVLEKVKEASFDVIFSKITSKEIDEVSQWVKDQEFRTQKEKDFEKVLKVALTKVDYEYSISNIEPSVDEETGKLTFAEDKPVAVGYSCNQLKEMCKAYNPERGSRMANLYELFIWYAYRIMEGYWTLNFVANDSSSEGNYWNAPNATHCRDKTTARICGGFMDGQGNTYKVVTHPNGFALVGGSCNEDGFGSPVSNVNYNYNPLISLHYSSCVVVLTK